MVLPIPLPQHQHTFCQRRLRGRNWYYHDNPARENLFSKWFLYASTGKRKWNFWNTQTRNWKQPERKKKKLSSSLEKRAKLRRKVCWWSKFTSSSRYILCACSISSPREVYYGIGPPSSSPAPRRALNIDCACVDHQHGPKRTWWKKHIVWSGFRRENTSLHGKGREQNHDESLHGWVVTCSVSAKKQLQSR